jgi:hypothetical protein
MDCLHTGEAHELRNIPGNEARTGHDFDARPSLLNQFPDLLTAGWGTGSAS